MEIRLRDRFNAFRSFITTGGTQLVFTSLFYALWLVISYVSCTDLSLHAFTERMISSATLEALDIPLRIGLLYKSIAVLCLSFIFFNLSAYFISRKTAALLISPEVKAINYASLAGIFLFLFQLFEIKVSETLEVIYFLHKFLLAGILLKLVFKKNIVSVYHYALILCLASALYFFVSDCCVLAGAAQYPDFFIVTFILTCLLLIALNVFLQRAQDLHKYHAPKRLAFILVPLTLLPLVSVLKDELILILKANDIVVQNRLPIFAGLVVLVALLIYRRYKKVGTNAPATEKMLVATSYFPMLIFSFVTYTYYSYYTDYYDELFEMGNVYLPMMEFVRFGILPPFEKLNTHLLSDYFFGATYAAFSGLKQSEIILYDFMLASVSYLLHYYLLYYITRNPFIALFSILLFPFADILLPAGYCLSILGIFALNKILFHRQTFKSYLAFFSILLLIMLWRIDMAYNCVIAMPLLLLYYHFSGRQYKINMPALLKAGALVGASFLFLVIGMCLYRQVNMFSKIPYMLHYLSSAQSYGYLTLGISDQPSYKMHYFVFPALAGIILIVAAFKFKAFNKTKAQALAYLCFVFMCVFYILNFNRGLTRHSLIEGTDFFVSFLYLLLACLPFFLLRKQTQVVKFTAFCAIAFFAIVSFHIPDTKGAKSVFEAFQSKVKTPGNNNPLTVKSRLKNIPADTGAVWRPFVDFVNRNLAPGETYIDFANKPVLYFYTGRITPSWFYQNPLCIHDDFLQKRFIDDLKDYKTPYLLFSPDPGKYSMVDGVPDVMRHYRMAEYFYNNFEPYILLGQFIMWKRKDLPDVNKTDTLYSFKKDLSTQPSERIVTPGLQTIGGKKYLVRIVSTAALAGLDLKLFSSAKDSVSPAVTYITDTLAYAPVEPGAGSFSLSCHNNGSISRVDILQCDYLPDFYSEQYMGHNFKQLPYIWGTYDKTLLSEPVLYQKDIPAEEHPAAYNFTLPETLDRSSGNTVVITCANHGKKTKTLLLSFGNALEKNRTTLLFDVLPSDKPLRYAIRVSCIYKWYSGNVNHLGIWANDYEKNISITSLQITKGN